MAIDFQKLQKEVKKLKGKKSKDGQVKFRKVLKKSSVEVRIPEFKAPSILNDPNRFFTHEMEETRKSMFLS